MSEKNVGKLVRLTEALWSGPAMIVIMGLLGISAVAVAIVLQAELEQPCLWMAALLPTAMVGNAVYLAIPCIGEARRASRTARPRTPPEAAGETRRERIVVAVRFGIPALLLLTTIVTVGSAVSTPGLGLGLSQQVIDAGRMGAIGAYLYVVLYLGRRSLQKDVTPVAVVWSAAVLATGTILGAVLPLLFNGGELEQVGEWTGQLLPFAAGFSTRVVVTLVEGAIRKFVGNQPDLRSVSLTTVQGVTREVADRLGEEGILDTAGLSRADPFRLMEHTPYDLAQITRWIDEAILITDLSHAWEALQKEGIPAATYLSEYKEKKQRTKGLAQRINLTAESLEDAVVRLAGDEQVQLLRAIRQRVLDGSDQPQHASEERGPGQPASRAAAAENLHVVRGARESG